MTLRVSPELEKRLTAVASTMKRDPQDVLDEAVKDYIEDEGGFLAAVQEGRDAIARGEGIPHARLMAEIDAIVAAAEQRTKAERRE